MKTYLLQLAAIVAGAALLSQIPISDYRQEANISDQTEISSFDLTLKGETSGTGTYFEITDSDYLNVSLQSSETITVALSSQPKIVSLTMPSPGSSTQLTVGGLAPNATYYLFDNSHKNEVVFTSSPSGGYTWTQDLSGPHYVWIQETGGTVFLPEDCDAVGTLNGSTCVLDQDVNDTIEVTDDGLTLDCNDNTVSSPGLHGILLVSRQNVTIKNCLINNSGTGIRTTFSNSNTFADNTVSDNTGTGINIGTLSNANTVSGNTVSRNRDGVLINNAAGNTVNNNSIQSNSLDGIAIIGSFTPTSENVIKNNQIEDNGDRGIFISGFDSQFNNVINNSISNNSAGIVLSGFATNNKIFNNNFLNNAVQITFSGNFSSPNFFDNGLPDGGNYWSDYDEPAEGCDDADNDGFCDGPRVLLASPEMKDNFPWTERDGWKEPSKVNINLSWSKNEDPDFGSYRIFRDTNQNLSLDSALVATITDQNQISYTDSGLDAGIIYHYKMFVFDRIGLSSGSNPINTGP